MTELQIDRTACHMVRVFGLRAQGEAAALCRKICALQLVHGDNEGSGPGTRGMIHAV